MIGVSCTGARHAAGADEEAMPADGENGSKGGQGRRSVSRWLPGQVWGKASRSRARDASQETREAAYVVGEHMVNPQVK